MRRGLRAAAILATLAALLAHARVYAFLCDDAFISFRYARNMAEGYGLVFNPGFARVEGYTNFLWVLILAAGQRLLHMHPEELANPLLVLCTAGLWGLVVRRASDEHEAGEAWWPVLVAPALLAATRSVAVWSTSGLETRLFECLVVAAALRLLQETRSLTDAHSTLFPWSGLLFALATLTRPDGLLMAGCAMGVAACLVVGQWRRAWRNWILQGALFAVPVGAHFLWRFAYYGAWLPNTYYAKVGGRTWWEMGGTYIAAFALEYGAILWLPLLLFAIVRHARRHTLRVPLLYAAIVVPHCLYVARIGGDHFEYRPLDLYFPFLFLLVGDGTREVVGWVRRSVGGTAMAAGYGALVLLGLTWIPARSHVEFPSAYVAGFPGRRGGAGESARFLDPGSDPLLRLPGLARLAETHRDLIRETTSRFVGIRAEEHRLFLGTVMDTGRRMRLLVDRRLWPKDTHIAISAVGAIPYVTNLRTLDRLGLTDPVVARSAPADLRILAHDKHATFEYAAEQGVDLWSEDPVHPVLALDDHRLRFLVERLGPEESGAVWFADAGEDAVLVVRFPLGVERARARFPGVRFASVGDPGARDALLARIAAAERAELAENPASIEARVAAALEIEQRGDVPGAIAALRAIDPQDHVDVRFQLGNVLARAGRFEEAAAAFEQATRLSPAFAGGWYNLGLSLSRLERWAAAREAFERAIPLAEGDPALRYGLGVACLALGDRGCVEDQARSLDAMERETARTLAARLRSASP